MMMLFVMASGIFAQSVKTIKRKSSTQGNSSLLMELAELQKASLFAGTLQKRMRPCEIYPFARLGVRGTDFTETVAFLPRRCMRLFIFYA